MQEIALRIANEKMKPVTNMMRKEFPWDIVELMRQSDLLPFWIGEEYGEISEKL
jgi:hypothetical protein